MTRPTPSWTPPKEFEEYRLQRLIGAGGMGQVFLARDEVLDRAVAIKFISDLEPDQEARSRFLTEARAAARVAHPNVVAVHRVGEVEGRPFIVSEYVHGMPLSSLKLPLPMAEVLRIGVDLARGLAAAHRQGVLHRDLKPGNAVVTDEGPVKILDFGLAKLFTAGPLGEARPAVPVEATDVHGVTRKLGEGDPAVARASFSALAAPVLVDVARRTGAAGEDAGGRAAPARVPRPHVTAAGSVMGTPLYMAPEVWQGLPATRAGDIYALGAVLHELVSGRPPHLEHQDLSPSVLSCIVQDTDVPPVALAAPGLDPRLAELIDRSLRRAAHERYATVETVRDLLEQMAVTPAVLELEGQEPYRGLAAFDASHRAYFRGRAGETRAILDRLRGADLVVVAGDSGVGKSSICRAGILPLVTDGALGDGRQWLTRTVPIGRRPVAALAAAFADLLQRDEDELQRLLVAEPHAVVRELRHAIRHGLRGLLIFFDQMEELVTLASPADAAVVGALVHEVAAGVPGLKVLGSTRGDFLTRLASVSGIADHLQQAFYLLQPMSEEGIRQAIVGPAEALGVTFESAALVDELVGEASSASGGLPLLQFTLAELWRVRDPSRRLITRSSLAELGGVAGALARHADAVVVSLLPAQRRAARRIFSRLVTPEGTRARRGELELTDGKPEAQQALTGLVRGRLVVASEGGERGEQGTTYEITHETLLTGWDTLRRWLDEKAEVRAVAHRLELAAIEWVRLGQPDETLWGDAQLDEATGLDVGELRARESEFLALSRRRRRASRWRRGALLAGALLLVGGTWGGVQLATMREQEATRRASEERVTARIGGRVNEAKHLLAEATLAVRTVHTRRAAAFAAFARDEVTGEREWAAARVATTNANDRLLRAGYELELALVYGGGSSVRSLLADVLAMRAELADLEGRSQEREELIERLHLYDPARTRLRRFTAPAHLVLRDAPEGATLALARYQTWEGRLGLRPVSLPAKPVDVQLPPAAYLLTIRATGRPPLRWPVVLLPGGQEVLHLALPAAADHAPGFVYVPGGRFYRGAREADLRTSLHALPLHLTSTDAFLIGRRETTVEEWAQFLEALPEDQRARRTPATRAQARQTPVTGISPDDALAYTRWLATSGRVKGARLCSEAEWEHAARGADGRPFPQGDVLAASDGNFARDRRPRLSEVGSFPAGTSPFGLDDTAGNAREITEVTPGQFVGKGGAYDSEEAFCHAAARLRVEPRERQPSLGVRVCATVR